MPPLTIRSAVVLVLAVAAACGGGDGGATAPPPANQVGASGGVVTGANGAVKLTFPAGAVAAPTNISVTPIADPASDPAVLKGRTYEFGPDGTQFAQPVTLELSYAAAELPAGVPKSMLRVAKYVDGAWIPIHEGVRIDSATGKVTGTIRSFSKYGVIVGGCGYTLSNVGYNGGTFGFATANSTSCVYSSGRQVATVGFQVPRNTMIDFRSTPSTSEPLAGEFGLKQVTTNYADPMSGRVYTSATLGGRVRLVSDGAPVQLYVLTAPNATGFVTILGTSGAPSHSCDTDTYVVPGVSFPVAMRSDNSCHGTVKFPVIPEALGKPIDLHFYGLRAVAGQRYVVAIGGLSSSFSPTLTIFRGSTVVTQTGDSPNAGAKSLSFTAPADGLYVLEVSSGNFTDAERRNWVIPTGTYTLSVTQ